MDSNSVRFYAVNFTEQFVFEQKTLAFSSTQSSNLKVKTQDVLVNNRGDIVFTGNKILNGKLIESTV
jgi:hypothetical protein